jgi:hypothetical protein
MKQEPAGRGISGNDMLQDVLEVTLRLVVVPRRASRRQWLEMKTSVRQDVATIAAGVSRALLQKNRLDLRFENLEIKSIGVGGMRCSLSLWRSLW